MIIKSQDIEQYDLLNKNHLHFLLCSMCAYFIYTRTQTTHISTQGHFFFFYKRSTTQRYGIPYNKYNIDTQWTQGIWWCIAEQHPWILEHHSARQKVRVIICLKGKSPVLTPENQQLHFTLEDLIFPSRTWHPRLHFDWSQDFKFTWSWPKTLTTTKLHMPFWKVQEGVVLQTNCLLNQGMLFPSCSSFWFLFHFLQRKTSELCSSLHIN